MGNKSPMRGFAGNMNLKGKKFRMLSCRCCYVFDCRGDYRKEQDKKYIAEEIINHDLSD